MGLIGRFIRLPGTAERYLDAFTGGDISRRARDKLVDSAVPGELDKWNERADSTRFGRLAGDFADKHGLSAIQGANAGNLFRVVEGLRSGDTSPEGQMHFALVEVGRRLPETDYPVGETPDTLGA